MARHRRLVAALVLILNPATGALAAQNDACAKMIPAPLAKQLLAQFPTYRLPRVDDNSAEDVADRQQQGRSACLRVATGDFDGDGKKDLAVLLTPTSNGPPQLVAALKRTRGWQIDVLRTLRGSGLNAYVDAIKPGHYRTEGKPSEPGEVAEVTSRWSGIVTGTLEASAVAYFRRGGRWVHVWLSD